MIHVLCNFTLHNGVDDINYSEIPLLSYLLELELELGFCLYPKPNGGLLNSAHFESHFEVMFCYFLVFL
jgi:hypothetical protein